MPSKVTDYVRTVIDRTQGRSMVMSIGGIAASEHPLASQAGASILASGGSAVDAAIAVNAAMGVVAPMMNGVGGDLFAIVYDASSGELHGINASGWSPAALTIERLRGGGLTSMPQTGINSVTVPGAVAGWSMLSARFGRLSLSEVLSPRFTSPRKVSRSRKSRRRNGKEASRS
jgi:gamma-glutamyltranspeptidase/glutathione hydrolase